MTTNLEYPSAAKALIYDHLSQTFHFDSSYPVPIPDPERDDHLIRVHTTALCKGELAWPTFFPDAIFSDNPSKQIIPSYDVAGTVLTSPPNSRFHPGDEIIARTRPNRPGNCREYSICRSVEMAFKPPKLSWADAASIPVSALTAWQALFEHARVQGFDDPKARGKRVLIVAAAGSVGIWLTRLAKMASLEVIAQVGSEENDELVRKLGAAEVVNYRTTSLRDWAEKNGPVDVVFDLLGGKALEDAWFCVRDEGALISIVEPPEQRRPPELQNKPVENKFFILTPDSQQLAKLAEFANEGQCMTLVDSIWSLENHEGAFARLSDGHPRGKVVIEVKK